MTAWYKNWFNELYSELYRHRSPEEAQRHIQFLLTCIPRPRVVLDVACGAGRHLCAWNSVGIPAYGVDLSITLLEQAPEDCSLVCGDMREIPFAPNSFSLLTSFFTSFGYFESDLEHQALLAHWHELLTPSGYLFMDYLNEPFLRKNLVAHSERTIHGIRISERREIDESAGRIVKTIAVIDASGNVKESFRESVRLYSEQSLRELLISSGFTVDCIYGDFAGSEFSNRPEAPSERMLILARKRD